MDLYNQLNTHLPLYFIIGLPLLILCLFCSIYFIFLIKLNNDNSNSNIKSMFFYVIQFVSIPLVLLFLTINMIMLIYSLLRPNSSHFYYLSWKNVFNFFSKFCCTCRSKNTNLMNSKVINIVRKQDDKSLPERAQQYKIELEREEMNSPDKLKMNLPIDLSKDRSIFELENFKSPAQNAKPVQLEQSNNYVNYLSNVLVKDNSPSYVSILDRIKNKMKSKVLKRVIEINDKSDISGNSVIINKL